MTVHVRAVQSQCGHCTSDAGAVQCKRMLCTSCEGAALQVTIGLIGIEVRRQSKKDRAKEAKEREREQRTEGNQRVRLIINHAGKKLIEKTGNGAVLSKSSLTFASEVLRSLYRRKFLWEGEDS